MARYRLTESRLRGMIREAVIDAINESWQDDYFAQQPSREMRSQILNDVQYYVQDKHGFSPLSQKYGLEGDALDNIENDEDAVRLINSNRQGKLRLSDYFGDNNTVLVDGNSVVYYTYYYYVTDIDPEGNINKIVVPKDEMGRMRLRDNDGPIVVRFDRRLLQEYFKQYELEGDFENDPKYIEMRDNHYRQKQEKEEERRRAEELQQQIIAKNLANRKPTSPERQKQIDDMWRQYRKNRY